MSEKTIARMYASATTTDVDTPTAATIVQTLASHPEGITSRKLAGETNLGLARVNASLAAMHQAGTASNTPGARKGAELWTIAVPADADDAPDETAHDDSDRQPDDTSDATTTDDTDDNDTHDSNTDDGNADTNSDDSDDSDANGSADAPVSGAPVSGGPVGGRDHLKVIMVAAILGDHTDGVSAFDIATESGLRAQVVGRVLAAMEAVDAARRVAGESGGEMWVRGDGDLSTVDLDNVTPTIECPNCAHRIPLPAGAGARRTGTRRAGVSGPGVNGDGQAKFAKGELRQLVLDFVNAHPGHMFNAGTVTRELMVSLGRVVSPGAVGNNLNSLVALAKIRPADADGKEFTALADAPGTTTDTDADEKAAESAGQ
jgi:hypothetical protein